MLQDPACIRLMTEFIRAWTELWNEDIRLAWKFEPRDESLEARIVTNAIECWLDIRPRYVAGVFVERSGEPLEAAALIPQCEIRDSDLHRV